MTAAAIPPVADVSAEAMEWVKPMLIIAAGLFVLFIIVRATAKETAAADAVKE